MKPPSTGITARDRIKKNQRALNLTKLKYYIRYYQCSVSFSKLMEENNLNYILSIEPLLIIIFYFKPNHLHYYQGKT